MRKFNSTNLESSYKLCPYAEKVKSALSTPVRRFPMLKNYIFIIDEEANDTVILFPSSDINRVNKQLKDIVFKDLIDNFKKSGLTLIERKGIITDVYRVGFIAVIFSIKSS